MNTAADQPEKGAVDLCEEATFLLRSAPAGVWASYFLGTMPFLLGLLYFWSDMTRGFQAGDRLVLGSLALALLFVWMKYWQVIFATRLRHVITDTEPDRLSLRDGLRIVAAQARWQPWGLILLPISAVIALPLGWVYAYYQNLVALGANAASRTVEQDIHKTAVSQSKLWPKQNHLLLLIISGLWMIVLINVAIALVLIPKILVTFLGVKGVFEPTFWLILNTTFLALVTVITHLVLDPFIKAVYVLRCFYGESQTTGEDLRVRMLRAAKWQQIAAQALVACTLFTLAPSATAAERTEELNTAIDEVLQQSEYKWKLPREVVETQDRGPLAEFLAKIGEAINRALRATFNGIRSFFDWLGDKFGRNPVRGNTSWSFGNPQVLLYLCLIAVAILLIMLIVRNRHRFRSRAQIVHAEAVAPIPDLRSEDVAADALPQDEWMKLAEQMRLTGDLRLAIRALFLAALSDLAQRQVLSLAKFKSNRDYQRELTRRSAAVPQRPATFSALTGIYERVWYGPYEASETMFSECEENVRFLKTC